MTKTKAPSKTYSEKEYKEHGETLFDIGKCQAFQSVLKTDVVWCIDMPNEDWNLDTVIIGDGSLKDITFENPLVSYMNGVNITAKAKDGTVKEVWLAANRAFKKAKKCCGDWHCYLESVELSDGKIIAFYGS